MTRALLLTPMLLAAALSAQVPTPPTPPAPPRAPRAMTVPVPAARPWIDITPDVDLNDQVLLNLDLALEKSDAFDNISRPFDSFDYSYAFDNANSALAGLDRFGVTTAWRSGGPIAWAQSDPADSLYRRARDDFNRGDYRRAADLFKSLPQKFANSVYIADAQYYQAFALYRIGGTPELQEALAVLEARKTADVDNDRSGRRTSQDQAARSVARAYLNAQTAAELSSEAMSRVAIGGFRGEIDAAGLAARIANVLSSRGLANDPAVKRALAAGGNTCDQEEQSVKAEALGALMQNDPETGRQMAVKILANRDECSVPLRRNAVMLVGNRHDEAAANTLIPVARSDPSPSVRMAALDYLIRIRTDAAVNAVIELARTNDDKRVQRAAVRALTQSANARARAEVRAIAESNTADESLRASVIDGFDRDRLTPEDGAWLRSLYAKTTAARLKERVVSALARAGGDANNQWLLALVRNEDESLDSRSMALERVGRTMDAPTLAKMYDASSQRPIRRTVLDLLAERKEPEALDKIVEVARSGTDIEMRRHAINILSRSKDPRASKLLLQLVDH